MSRIREINVHEYRKPFGQSGVDHQLIQRSIATQLRVNLPSLEIQTIDVYNMEGRPCNVRAGLVGRRLVILHNATFEGAHALASVEQGVNINGVETPFTHFLGTVEHEGNVVVTSEEGIALAEYSPRKEELNILFDLFGEFDDVRVAIFTYILKELERLVWYPKTLENSWLHTKDKASLTDRFTRRMREQREQQLENDKQRLREDEDSINYFKAEIKRKHDNVLRLRRVIDTETKNLNEVGARLINDLDLIANNPKVVDLQIKDDIFHVWTDDVYCYDKEDRRFYIGKMKFTMNLENTEVRFYNLNNPRRGYWTDHDPHPHVDGDSGNPCLGSIATTIAELCANNEVYALSLMCFDFLENANIADVAGEKVTRWDEVDEDGNIIREGHDEDERDDYCDCCEEYFHSDDMYGTVYESINDDGYPTDESYVCQGCRDDYYYFSEHFDETIHCDIDEDDYIEEDEEDEF